LPAYNFLSIIAGLGFIHPVRRIVFPGKTNEFGCRGWWMLDLSNTLIIQAKRKKQLLERKDGEPMNSS
jgi:hypothetical protein